MSRSCCKWRKKFNRTSQFCEGRGICRGYIGMNVTIIIICALFFHINITFK